MDFHYLTKQKVGIVQFLNKIINYNLKIKLGIQLN